MAETGLRIGNIDATIIAQAPKLAPHIPQMRENLSRALDTASDRINIKATTEEKLGFTGEKLGIAAMLSVCWKISPNENVPLAGDAHSAHGAAPVAHPIFFCPAAPTLRELSTAAPVAGSR